jgi:hypothetical protein
MANKKLTSSNILSLYNKTFTQKAIQVTANNQTFDVLIDEKFQPTKIQNLIMELAEKQQQIKNLNDILDLSFFANYLIIKYFTNIEMVKVDDLEKSIRVFKALVDLGIFEQIMDQFDEKEMQKVNEYIKKMSDKVKELDKNPEAKKDLEQIMNDLAGLQNPEIFMPEEDKQQ